MLSVVNSADNKSECLAMNIKHPIGKSNHKKEEEELNYFESMNCAGVDDR